ncbi:hypothetical protein [uncultured Enterovirga sp.]|uniref:hypothetical protein n=1 Tax=uncultured Enterovirga sp. TaxID=2026352 RepID=UPI0035CA92EB
MAIHANSTPAPARLHSRRTFLSSTTAVAAVGAVAAPALAAETDPVFALIEAEARAFDFWGDAITTFSRAETALWESEWRRGPRALVGHFTPMVRGRDYEPIPLGEQVAEPVYLHDHVAIDRDCDSDGKAPGADPAKVEARRARLHRELDEDAAQIAAAPEVIREAETEQAKDEAFEQWAEVRDALLAVPPTTASGLLALAALTEDRTHDGMDEDKFLAGLIAAVRSVVGGRA